MKKTLSILLSLILLLSLTACGSAAMDNAATAPMAPSTPSSPMPESSYDKEMGFDYAGGAVDTPSEPTAPKPDGGSGELVSSTLPENVKMIYRGYLYLESTSFDEAIAGLQTLVTQMGGYFETTQLNNYNPYRSAFYVVRVPAAKYNEFCNLVGDLAQLNRQEHTAENISEAYYDTESRLVTQRTKLERLQELLTRADKMEDIITLESAIAETELQIEYLTGTLRKYDALVDYATVEISLEEVYVLSEQEQPVIGFWPKLAEAFKTGTSRFVNDVESFALRFARNWVSRLIWLVIWIVVIVLAVRWLRKKKDFTLFRRKKKTQAPPPPPPAEEQK